jgi:nucleoside diphosphate kinase
MSSPNETARSIAEAAALIEQTEGKRLLYHSAPDIRERRLGLVIVKPCLEVPNANNSPQNIISITGRLAIVGWEAVALKVANGANVEESRVAEHYDRQFYDSKTPDVRPYLDDAERTRVRQLWGTAADTLPIYHAMQLTAAGRMSYKQIAAVWHKGRGENNELLDAGVPFGINTITDQATDTYGKRRLLLSSDKDGEFFILNGFTAEMMLKFTNPDEKIVSMVFAQDPDGTDLSYVRTHVVGATVPSKAKPGSIRHDALYAGSYTGPYPIMSLEKVGVENNIIHMSDSQTAAQREIVLWVPELSVV